MSTLTVPMIAPAERVRVATAPSMVMRFSSARLPLMLKPPLLRLSGWKLLRLPPAPPRTPGLSSARLMGLRPFNIRSWICRLSIVFAIWPVLLCSGVAAAITVTSSSTPPGDSTRSAVTLAPESSVTPAFTNLRKPESSAITWYLPGAARERRSTRSCRT